VVDTGSTDRTVEIARRFGARVEFFPWVDDFAAARNESLRHATGDWIFWMDADDRLTPENLNRLKRALVSNRADVYSARIISPNAQHHQSRAIAHHLRLFRNGLGLAFIYPLHEDLNLAAAAEPVTLAYTNIEIEHVGYVLGDDLLKAKTRRNLGIIRKCLADDPQSVRWHHHLGLSLAMLDDHAPAIKALEFVVASGGQGISEVEFYYSHLWLIALYSKTQRFEKAEALFRRAMTRFPARQHLFIAAGMFYLNADDPAAARRWLEKAAALPAESLTVQGQTWLPGTLEGSLGQAYLLLGDDDRARQWYAAADVAALRRDAKAAFEAQDWARAVDAFAHAIALGAPAPDDRLALATALIFKTGKTGSAARICQRVLAAHPAHPAADDLLTVIRQNEDFWQTPADAISVALAADRREQALSLLRRVAALLFVSPLELIRQHGLRCIHRQDYAAATEAFALLVDLSPADAAAYKSLGVSLNGLGMAQDAIAAWQIAQQLEANTVT